MPPQDPNKLLRTLGLRRCRLMLPSTVARGSDAGLDAGPPGDAYVNLTAQMGGLSAGGVV